MSRIDVSEVIDRGGLRPVQVLVLALCALCLVVDGFDVQALSYVAPAIAREWHIAKAGFGPVFGAALLGMCLGALTMGAVADRYGRKPVLVGALLFVSACSFATMYATSLNELLLCRLVTGLGMGAIVPNATALAGEYSPARMKVGLMMLISTGFIAGGVAGGVYAASLVPAHGWQSVFLAGAIAPAAIAVLMIFLLPESLQFMVLRGRPAAGIARVLSRIAPDAGIGAGTTFASREAAGGSASIAALFRDRMAGGTLLLWTINFMNLLCAYFLANWLPSVMGEAGHAPADAVLAGTMLWGGGMAGNLLLGWMIDRHGFGRVLVSVFACASLAIAAIGQVAGVMPSALAAIAVAGFCVIGGQAALNAVAAIYYPTAIRTTGIGWAMGIGRLGSILGPVVGGELLRLNWASGDLFLAAAVPPLLAMGASLLFARRLGGMPRTAPAREANQPGVSRAGAING
jgi:AAHS family 4-hydroxybenzoate transporter-like MFS transporter